MSKKKKAQKASPGKNSFALTVLNVFTQNPYKSHNFRQLAHSLGISDRVSKNLVKDILSDLGARGEIIDMNRGKYKLNPDNIKTIKS